MSGFYGTPPFVHEYIFRQHPCTEWVTGDEGKKYDFFGLVLTLCALHTSGKPSWNMGRFPRSMSTTELKAEFNQKVEGRQAAVTAWIQVDKQRFVAKVVGF